MLNRDQIGGGIVRRRFSSHMIDPSAPLLSGRELTREEILGIPAGNLRSLVENRFIELFPIPRGGGERFVIGAGKAGQYNVVEGRQINDAPLTLAEARDLAGSLDD